MSLNNRHSTPYINISNKHNVKYLLGLFLHICMYVYMINVSINKAVLLAVLDPVIIHCGLWLYLCFNYHCGFNKKADVVSISL